MSMIFSSTSAFQDGDREIQKSQMLAGSLRLSCCLVAVKQCEFAVRPRQFSSGCASINNPGVQHILLYCVVFHIVSCLVVVSSLFLFAQVYWRRHIDRTGSVSESSSPTSSRNTSA